MWVHLVSSAIWVGGLITLGALVPAVRGAGADRSILQAMARQYGRLSWGAMGVAVLSGGWMAIDFLDQPALAVKMGLVFLAAALAAWHQFAAKNQTPRARGMLQAAILVVTLGIVGAAVAL